MSHKNLLSDEILREKLLEYTRNDDVENLSHYFQQDTNSNRLYYGVTLLDQALLSQSYKVAEYLEKNGAYRKLSDEQMAEIRQESKAKKPGKYKCQANFELTSDNQSSLKFNIYDIETNELVKCVTLEHDELQQESFFKDSFIVVTEAGTKKIIWMDEAEVNKLNAVFQLDAQGDVHLLHLHEDVKDLTLSSPKSVHLSRSLSLGTLTVNANNLTIQENIVVEGKQCHFAIKEDITQHGNLNLYTLKAECDNYAHHGQTFLLNEFDIKARGRFNQHQTLMSRLGGNVHATLLENHRGSVIRVAEGKLHLYGKAALKNSGSIVSDYLTLDSRHLINNYLGAHISAITCIVPPNMSQFNNSGFYMVGRKASQSAWDKAFNFAHYGVQAAGMLSVMPQDVLKTMKAGLELCKLLYEAAGLLSRIEQGKLDEISADEWIHFFIDHVAPTVGLIGGASEKISFICSFLYQAYGWSLGEQQFIEKSLGLMELVIKGMSRFADGKFSPEMVSLLEKSAMAIKGSKYAIQYANTTAEILLAFYNGDRLAQQNYQDLLISIGDVWIREGLYQSLPNKIFDLELSPRDLALFVTNRGFALSKKDMLQRGVSTAIYALHKSKHLSDDAKADWQYGSHIAFSLSSTSALIQKYQDGTSSYSEVMEQVLLQVAALASYRAQKNVLNRHVEKNETAEIDNETAEIDEDLEAQEPEDTATETGEDVTEETTEEIIKSNPECDDPNEENNESRIDPDELDIPDLEKIKEKTDEKAKEFTVEYTPKRLTLTLNVESMLESWLSAEPEMNSHLGSNLSWRESLLKAWEKGIQPEYASAFQEFLRTVRGECDLSQQGYLGVYANTLHNEGILDSTANIAFNAENARNAGSIHASRDIELQGNDVANRDTGKKIINKNLRKEGLSHFINDSQGTMSAGGDIATVGVGNVQNKGMAQCINYKSIDGLKNHTNSGHLIAENNVEIRASEFALNRGVTIGRNVTQEGTLGASINQGFMNGQESIQQLSKGVVEESESSTTVSKRVTLSGGKIIKEGAIQGALVQTIGYDSDRPEEVVWRRNDNDHITGLVLNPTDTFMYDADAFNRVQMTSLQLNADYLKNDKFLNLSPDFNNTIQLEVPENNATISLEQLPAIGKKGNFILHAPGATLEGLDADKFECESEFNFIGKAFQYNGDTTFNKGGFDVERMTGVDAHTSLNLINGGTIQADNYTNNGSLKSNGEVGWNVKNLTNDAQLELNEKQYYYSKKNPEINTFHDRVVIEGSGTINTYKNTGYIGNLEMTGGRLISGDGGNYLYINNATLKPLWGETSKYTLGYVEDRGRSWCHIPFAINAVIGSSGVNVLQGTGAMNISGADIYGDGGNFVHFNGGVHIGTESQSFKIHAAWSREKGKNHQTVNEQSGSIITKNNISSNNSRISLASANGSIILGNTIFACPGSADLVAKNKITIDGKEYTQTSSSKEKHHSIKGKKTKTSETKEVLVNKSYIFIGGDLNVSCMEFNLGAVTGQVGDMNVTALTTTLNGKKSSYENKTTTQSVSIGLPTDSLISLLSSHNAKAIFSTLVRNAGLDKDELNALLNARNATEIPGHLVHVAKGIWDLTAIASHACNAMGNNSIGEFASTITDQLGLTYSKNGKPTFNAKFSLKVSKTTEHTKQTNMVSTELFIAGTFRLEGNKLRVLDGSKIDAKNLIIALADGIEMTAGKDTFEYKKTDQKGSVGVQAYDPTSVELSYSQSGIRVEKEMHTLAGLNAREGAFIKNGKAITGAGKITAKYGFVASNSMSFETKQNKHEEKHESFSVTLSGDITAAIQGASGGIGYNHSKTSIVRTEEKAGIYFSERGDVITNSVHLGGGSVLDLGQGVLQRADGQEGLPTVTSTDGYDHDYKKQMGFSAQASGSSGTGMGSVNYVNQKTNITQRASIYSGNVKNGDFGGSINTNRENETEITRSTRRGLSLAAYKTDKREVARQKEEISSAAEMLIGKAKEGLHFFYPRKSNVPILPDNKQYHSNTDIYVDDFNEVISTNDAVDNIYEISKNSNDTPENTYEEASTFYDDTASPAQQEVEEQKKEEITDFSQAYGLENEHYWQALNVNSVDQAKYTTAEWFGLLLRSSLGEKSSDVTEWQEFNRLKTADGILKAFKGVRDSVIPINELPEIFGKAAGNAAVGLVEGGIATVVFTGKEIGRQFRREELETVNAIRLLSVFVGEEKARFLVGQELESTKAAKKLAHTFNQMDKRERVQALAELGASLVIPMAVGKVAGEVVNVGGSIVDTFTPRYNSAKRAANVVHFNTGFKSLETLPNSMGTADIFQFQLMKKTLEQRTLTSLFNPDGTLTMGAIKESRKILDVKDFNKAAPVYKELLKYGDIHDWGKYTTDKFHTLIPSNNIAKNSSNLTAEVHFYQNKVTGQIYYDMDYKVKYDLPKNPSIPVKEFLNNLPKEWKMKP